MEGTRVGGPGVPGFAGPPPWAPDEEYMILRCPEEAAWRLRKALREEPEASADDAGVEIEFKGETKGKFKLGQSEYKLAAKRLPTVTEVWKSYNDVDLVKSGDIGCCLEVQGKEAEGAGEEARDGVSPALKDARRRFFKRPHGLSEERIAEAEGEIHKILSGQASAKPLQEDEVAFQAEWVDEDSLDTNDPDSRAPIDDPSPQPHS